MQPRTRRAALIAVTVCVWAAALIASVGKFKLAARSNVTINLATKPPVVRLLVDDGRVYDGTYVDTPVKITVAPGRHKLKISRDGYIAHIVTVEGDPGEVYHMEDVVLQKNPVQAFAAADVVAADGPAVHLEIDDGLVRGDTPLISTDLVADIPHVLTIYPKWPDKDTRVRCRFTPAAKTEETAIYHIILRGKGNKLKLQNCDRPKDLKDKKAP